MISAKGRNKDGICLFEHCSYFSVMPCMFEYLKAEIYPEEISFELKYSGSSAGVEKRDLQNV